MAPLTEENRHLKKRFFSEKSLNPWQIVQKSLSKRERILNDLI